MKAQIEKILFEIKESKACNAAEAEALRIKWLGKRGDITLLFEDFKNALPEERKELGKLLNELKSSAKEKLQILKSDFGDAAETGKGHLDLSMPPEAIAALGSNHPITIVRNEIVKIFEGIGFLVSDGPEIEDDWHNFTALNTPPDHPARDMQDTFYLQTEPAFVLRTQTSSVQVHQMEKNQPPIRTLSPGRVYRNETVSARSHCQFHQIEGLYIDENVSFADLKQTLMFFVQSYFGASTKIKLRPSYFPFTEPSAEVDISCTLCSGKGCNVCKNTGWLEILGCGMVDPQVLTNCGIDPEKYSGFAFGLGIERIAMLKYRITDIRNFFQNDIRFLKQFSSL